MTRASMLKVALVVIGLLFVALAYPALALVRQEPAVAMMLSLYVTLGVFLLLAVRDPAANRSLIAFTAWSSFAHAGVMGYQLFHKMIAHGELIGVVVLAIIGVVLVVLAPAKHERGRAAVENM